MGSPINFEKLWNIQVTWPVTKNNIKTVIAISPRYFPNTYLYEGTLVVYISSLQLYLLSLVRVNAVTNTVKKLIAIPI